MDPLAVAGLAGLLLVKEAGVPVPVPGDLLVIGAGVALAGNPPAALAVLLLILAVGYLGGSLQFALARRVLRRPLLGGLARVGIPESRIERLADRFRRTGARGVAVARMTPGLRIAAIVAAGLAAIRFPSFLAGLVVGNGIFVAAHFGLGYALGASAGDAVAGVGGIGLFVAIGILAVVGAIGWLVVRRRRRSGAPIADWTDAACPACLAVVALGGDPLR
jgi:membrane protein DedA with SNARE-associated domain